MNLFHIRYLGILLFSVILVATACKEDEDTADDSSSTEQTNNNNGSSVSSASISDTNVVNALENINKAVRAYKLGNDLWPNYNLSTFHAYYVVRSNPHQGYLINPKSVPSGAIEIKDDKWPDTRIYEYHEGAKAGSDHIGNHTFSFNYTIDGKSGYYVQIHKTGGRSKGPNVRLYSHEVFHKFQDRWRRGDGLQDQNNYPLTKDLIALQLLTLKVFDKDAAKASDEDLRKDLLTYVAIRSEEMSIDPSSSKLVRRMANYQENGEGTARYIENIVIYNEKLTTELNFAITSRQIFSFDSNVPTEDLRGFFAWGIWYDTGSFVTYALDRLGHSVFTQTESGKSLYDQAKSFLGASDAELRQALADAKAKHDWTELQRGAEIYANKF